MSDDLKFKRKYLGGRIRHRYTGPALMLFNPPTCRACGTEAFVEQEPDGACGDSECCPQTYHAEYFCPNLECPTLTERAR